jgi:type IV pilus assembly protein PilN
MIRINLLPHRQLKREARQRQFNMMAVLSGIAAAGTIFLGSTFISSKIDNQIARNNRLNDEIAKLDKEIADIKTLKDQIRVMLERKQVVENLQTDRNQSVVILDELSRQLPDGMFYKSIKQQGNKITLEGVADTNARVATLVRNVNGSNWLTSPNLVEIKSVANNSAKQNVFTVNVDLKPRQTETEEAIASSAHPHH